MERRESLVLRFEGSNYIDAENLRDVLDGAIESMSAISEEYLSDRAYRKFEVEAPERGSFILKFWTVVMPTLGLALQYHEEIKKIQIFY